MEHLLLQEPCRHFHYMESIDSDRNSGPDGPFSSELHTEVPWQKAVSQGMPLKNKGKMPRQCPAKGSRENKMYKSVFPSYPAPLLLNIWVFDICNVQITQSGFEHQACSTQAGPLEKKRLEECTSPLTASSVRSLFFGGQGELEKVFLQYFFQDSMYSSCIDLPEAIITNNSDKHLQPIINL